MIETKRTNANCIPPICGSYDNHLANQLNPQSYTVPAFLKDTKGKIELIAVSITISTCKTKPYECIAIDRANLAKEGELELHREILKSFVAQYMGIS